MALVEEARRALLEKRASLLERRAELRGEQSEISDHRETDFPDLATDEATSQLIGHLDTIELMELERVTRAIERISTGEYGKCTSCGARITVERLRALPEADRCTDCLDA